MIEMIKLINKLQKPIQNIKVWNHIQENKANKTKQTATLTSRIQIPQNTGYSQKFERSGNEVRVVN